MARTDPPPDDAREAAPPSAAPRGRPSSLTPTVRRQLLEALRQGNTRSAAAQLAGIAPSTLSSWLARADPRGEPVTPWDELRADVQKAEAEAEREAVAQLHRPGDSAARYAAWWLENRYPEQWGKPSRRARKPEPEAEALAPVIMDADLVKLSDEQLHQVARGELSAGQVAGLAEAARVSERTARPHDEVGDG